MTKQEQINRIQKIMKADITTTCNHCKKSYVAFKVEFETDFCPLCNTKFVDEFIPTEETEYISQCEIKSLINL